MTVDYHGIVPYLFYDDAAAGDALVRGRIRFRRDRPLGE